MNYTGCEKGCHNNNKYIRCSAPVPPFQKMAALCLSPCALCDVETDSNVESGKFPLHGIRCAFHALLWPLGLKVAKQ